MRMIPELMHLPMNPELKGQAELIGPLTYSRNGQKLILMLPWAPKDDRTHRAPCPVILFVQGSAWTSPNLNYEIPMLSRYAEEGFAVATVTHRSIADGFPFPAFLEDVKCAVRFLRAHAAQYALDPERIAAFGTSSGGHTVCMLGLTGDDPAFRTDEYPDVSDSVCSVISCFGPTDLNDLFAFYHHRKGEPNEWLASAFGPDADAWDEQMRRYSPTALIRDGQPYPPFLLLHGTADTVVPVRQMDALYTRLKEAGAKVTAWYVDGAEHEGNFWSREVRIVIHNELMRLML